MGRDGRKECQHKNQKEEDAVSGEVGNCLGWKQSWSSETTPRRASPYNNEFPSTREDKNAGQVGLEEQASWVKLPGNQDLPSFDILHGRQCWLDWEVAPRPTETAPSGMNENYLTTPGHISKQARAGRRKTIWHPRNCWAQEKHSEYSAKTVKWFLSWAPADPTQIFTSGSLQANISRILCSWYHSKHNLGRSPNIYPSPQWMEGRGREGLPWLKGGRGNRPESWSAGVCTILHGSAKHSAGQ